MFGLDYDSLNIGRIYIFIGFQIPILNLLNQRLRSHYNKPHARSFSVYMYSHSYLTGNVFKSPNYVLLNHVFDRPLAREKIPS